LRSELEVPLAQRPGADLDAVLLEPFLGIMLPKGKAVIEPERLFDVAQRKMVAVGLAIGPPRLTFQNWAK